MPSDIVEFELNTIVNNEASLDKNLNDSISTEIENQDLKDEPKKLHFDRVNSSQEIEDAYDKSIKNEMLPLAVANPLNFHNNSDLTGTAAALKIREIKKNNDKGAFKSKKYQGTYYLTGGP